MNNRDTIAAPVTPSGRGGVGIIRLSGPLAQDILSRLFRPTNNGFEGFRPWMLHHGMLLDGEDRSIDDVLAVFMPGPKTFTGEDITELHCHGSPAILASVMERACTLGARPAVRGEFTRRAFMNGRMDLSQAEAVAEIIAAPGPESARWAAARLEGHLGKKVAALRERIDALRAHVCLAVDFPDDEIDAELSPESFSASCTQIANAIQALTDAFERTRGWREGLRVALAGPVNAGKSSLLNLLVGRERALVSPVPGTTRDYLEEDIRIADLPVRLVDTAGLHAGSAPSDVLEAEGIHLGRKQTEQADMVLLLIDGAQPDKAFTASVLQELGPVKTLLVWNKKDIAPAAQWLGHPPFNAALGQTAVAARSGDGLDEFLRAFRLASDSLPDHGHEPEPDVLVPNLRQTEALRAARAELDALGADAGAGVPWDLCAVRLDGVAAALDDVTGESTPEDVLNMIFDSFCIGK